MNKYIELIEKFEDETELPATWNSGGMGGYTKEFTEWLAEKVVKNCSIPDVGQSLAEIKSIAFGDGSASERMEEIKKLLSQC